MHSAIMSRFQELMFKKIYMFLVMEKLYNLNFIYLQQDIVVPLNNAESLDAWLTDSASVFWCFIIYSLFIVGETKGKHCK